MYNEKILGTKHEIDNIEDQFVSHVETYVA